MNSAIHLISQAKNHEGCSEGEYHLFMFIRSCLELKSKVNMKEVIYRADIEAIKEVIELSQSSALETLVKEINPSLLD